MNKYTMTPVHAVYFLNLWMPEENFFYIPAEAKAWADFMEYPAEFGNGASLDLAAYYAMCEDLVTALADYPDLIAQHKERLRTHLGGINDRLHLLAYDTPCMWPRITGITLLASAMPRPRSAPRP